MIFLPPRRWPWATLVLLVAAFAVYGACRRAATWGLLSYWMNDFAFSPPAFFEAPLPTLPRLATHLFLHVDPVHFWSNAIFLAAFGPAVERRIGSLLFVLAFFIWGAAGALVQGGLDSFSASLIGASGAISGAAGAFFVLSPLAARSEPRGMGFPRLSAFLLVGAWYAAQIFYGMQEWNVAAPGVVRVAHWAHVGGFLTGAISVSPLVLWGETSSRISSKDIDNQSE